MKKATPTNQSSPKTHCNINTIHGTELSKVDDELLIERIANLESQQNKAVDKLCRRDLTDEIKTFIEYAKAQGSKGSRYLYINITKWINKACGIDSVTDADAVELANVSTACGIVINAIIKGMSNNECYKTIKAKIKANLNTYSFLIKGVKNVA